MPTPIDPLVADMVDVLDDSLREDFWVFRTNVTGDSGRT